MPWRSPHDPEFRKTKVVIFGARHRAAENRLRELRRGLRRVSDQFFRGAALRSALSKPGDFLPLAFLSFLVAYSLGFVILSPWPTAVDLRHLAAFPNCAAARAVKLAPAYRGEPGYWSLHDADHDGIACEPYPRRR